MSEEKPIVYRAGVIPYVITPNGIEMMFMKPSNPLYGGPDFQIAKGRVESGEDTLTSALREGFEELGLLQENIESTSKLGVYLGRTTIFLAKVKDKEAFGDFHYETGATTWMTAEQFSENGRYLHKFIVQDAAEWIRAN